MMSEDIEQLAEELPEHQSSRGDEFRDMSMRERRMLARKLVQARSQANATHADWDNEAYCSAMVEKRVSYSYIAGMLGIDPQEARYIWWSVVHDNPSPQERRDMI